MARLTQEEAIDLCFRGKSNVAHAAADVGCSLDELKNSLSEYVSRTPVDSDVWQADVEPSWPWR